MVGGESGGDAEAKGDAMTRRPRRLQRRRRLATEGRLANVKGERSERRVVALLRRTSGPWWLKGARRATDAEDAAGIDVVVTARDLGEMALQVKSSAKEAAAFRAREGERCRAGVLGIVVVNGHVDDPTAYGRVLAALIRMRERRGA